MKKITRYLLYAIIAVSFLGLCDEMPDTNNLTTFIITKMVWCLIFVSSVIVVGTQNEKENGSDY